jgi:hypothetical protein
MLLRLHTLVPDERAAANQEQGRYWADLRVLMHLLDTRVIAPRDPDSGKCGYAATAPEPALQHQDSSGSIR